MQGAESTCKALPNEALCNSPRKRKLITSVYPHNFINYSGICIEELLHFGTTLNLGSYELVSECDFAASSHFGLLCEHV